MFLGTGTPTEYSGPFPTEAACKAQIVKIAPIKPKYTSFVCKAQTNENRVKE